MSSEYMPEQKGPKVTFDNYVIPETVQEFAPPPPADPVAFTQAPAMETTQPQALSGLGNVRFDPDLISKGLLVLAVFVLAALIGYLTAGDGGTSQEALLSGAPNLQLLSETRNGPRLTITA